MSNDNLSLVFGAMIISFIATIVLLIFGHWGIGIVTAIIAVMLWWVIKDE